MKLYYAPLEGIATSIFRTTHNELFGGCDAYFAPFITTSENERITNKTLKDILPENNMGTDLKVQMLSNKSGLFLDFVKKLRQVGYDEINLNFGCPSGTVVGKNRGAGFLRHPDELDAFLNDIFRGTDMKISVKTRIGFESTSEFEKLMKIYNRYPLSLLIIHPRTRNEMYGGAPHIEIFEQAYELSKNRLCYNGDVNTVEDYKNICRKFPNIDSVMIGRGAVRNPAIFREIRGGKPITYEEIVAFSKALAEKYNAIYQSEIFTVHKLKEIWLYIMQSFPEEKKTIKAIKKSVRLSDIERAAETMYLTKQKNML